MFGKFRMASYVLNIVSHLRMACGFEKSPPLVEKMENDVKKRGAPGCFARDAVAHSMHVTTVLIGAVFVIVSSNARAAVAGFTPGSFSVSPGGAANYSIPVAVPHGFADLQPTLSLEYSSQARSGLAGFGWTVSGTSTITRCPRTKRQDGVGGSVTFTSSDRFCLNGQRLVLDGTAIAYGGVGAVYRTEGENFSRVKALTSSVTGQMYFKMETKSGLIYDFGNTAASVIKPGPSVTGAAQPTVPLLWALNQVSDRFGNTMAYTYVVDAVNGSYAPDRITYNGGKAYVKFIGTWLSNAPSVRLSGTRVSSNYRLTSIESHVVDEAGIDTTIKKYLLSYESTGLSGVPNQDRLVSVKECGGGSPETCFAPLSFEWSFINESERRYSLNSNIGAMAPLSAGTDNFFYNNGFTSEGVTPRFVMDVDGDGLADLVGIKGDGVHVLLNSDATGWSVVSRPVLAAFGSSQGWPDQLKTPRQVVDVNADGYPDVLGFSVNGVIVSKWNAASKSYGAAYLALAAYGVEVGWNLLGGTDVITKYLYSNDDYVPRMVADMDGDSFVDIIGFAQGKVVVSYGNGTTFSSPATVSTEFNGDPSNYPGNLVSHAIWGPQSGTPRQLADMNGDGYPDIVGFGTDGVYIAIWDPVLKKFGASFKALSGFARYATTPGPANAWLDDNITPRRLVDVNGDGYPDVVGFVSDGIYVALWDGIKFLAPTRWATLLSGGSWSNEGVNPRTVIDVNTDGLADIVAFGTDGIHVLLNTGSGFAASATNVTKWANALGSGFVDVMGEQYNSEGAYPRKFADLDGDGLPDIVAFGKNGVFGSSPFFTDVYYPNPVTSRAGIRIVGFVDSLGARTDIQYSLAAGASGYYKRSATAGSPPVRDVIGPMVLVTQVSRSNGIGAGVIKERYRYSGLKAHPVYGSLGFEKMAVRDEQSGLETETTFSQTYPFNGQATKIETSRSTVVGETPLGFSCSAVGALCQRSFTVNRNATPISRVTNLYTQYAMGAAGEYSGNSRIFTFANQTVSEAWDLAGTPLPTKTTNVEYNEPALTGSKQWGNVTKVTVSHSDGHQTVTTNTYEAANESTWLLGRLSRATVQDTRPARTLSVPAPSDGGNPPVSGPMSPQVLNSVLSILLDD